MNSSPEQGEREESKEMFSLRYVFKWALFTPGFFTLSTLKFLNTLNILITLNASQAGGRGHTEESDAFWRTLTWLSSAFLGRRC